MLEHIPLGDRESFIGSPPLPPFSFPWVSHLLNSFAEGTRTKKHPAFCSGTKKNKHTGDTSWSLAEYKAVIQQRSYSLSDSREPALNNTAAEMMGGREEGREFGGREGAHLNVFTIFPSCDAFHNCEWKEKGNGEWTVNNTTARRGEHSKIKKNQCSQKLKMRIK